ncbi:MAG: Mrp/NBP35 family ATP-binding protein [Pseudomonadota bacterium]
MTEPLAFRVRNALAGVKNPQTGGNIVADGLVQGLIADDAGRVRFAVEVSGGDRKSAETLLDEAKAAASGVDGVTAVSAAATSHGGADRGGGGQDAPSPQSGGGHNNPLGLKRSGAEEAADALADVGAVIAVASGKGGVGKSTVAANLALALARAGYKTGLLDADIYGPSAPTLFGLSGKAVMEDGKIKPRRVCDIDVMSIGFLVDPEQALAWRGPMVMGALKQLIGDVAWGALDFLIIDTPPGTGDAHLSLIQTKRLDGAVIVSTPQEMALADMRRGVQLFRKTNIPVLGVIENMAWLETANGDRQYLFGKDGAKTAAQDMKAPFLGAIPLYPDLREASDAGAPLAAQGHPAAKQFTAIAKSVAAAMKNNQA